VVALAVVAVSGVLTALGHPFGDQATIPMVVLAVVAGVLSLFSFLDNARRRRLAVQEFSRLTVGAAEVTGEDRAGGRQSWPRTTITAVSVTSQYTGDEPGNSQVYYVVRMGVAGGPPVLLWSRATRDGFPLFDAESEHREPNIRAATAWLSATVRQAVGLSGVNGADTTAAP
jgi:hypothetical protein